MVKKNFNIHYEIDGEEVGSAMGADEYGGDKDFSWTMLEPGSLRAPLWQTGLRTSDVFVARGLRKTLLAGFELRMRMACSALFLNAAPTTVVRLYNYDLSKQCSDNSETTHVLPQYVTLQGCHAKFRLPLFQPTPHQGVSTHSLRVHRAIMLAAELSSRGKQSSKPLLACLLC